MVLLWVGPGRVGHGGISMSSSVLIILEPESPSHIHLSRLSEYSKCFKLDNCTNDDSTLNQPYWYTLFMRIVRIAHTGMTVLTMPSLDRRSPIHVIFFLPVVTLGECSEQRRGGDVPENSSRTARHCRTSNRLHFLSS